MRLLGGHGRGELLVVQIGLIPHYRRLKFSLGFWSFTFPPAAITVFIGTIAWRPPPGFSNKS